MLVSRGVGCHRVELQAVGSCLAVPEPSLQPHPLSLFETESLLNLEFTISPRLAARKPQGSPSEITGRHHCTGLFMWMLYSSLRQTLPKEPCLQPGLFFLTVDLVNAIVLFPLVSKQ